MSMSLITIPAFQMASNTTVCNNSFFQHVIDEQVFIDGETTFNCSITMWQHHNKFHNCPQFFWSVIMGKKIRTELAQVYISSKLLEFLLKCTVLAASAMSDETWFNLCNSNN